MKNFTSNADIKVAYAEDHEAIRKGIISLLDVMGGFDVMIDVSNGKELITSIEKTKVLPDVCIIDIGMPILNGFDTLVEIKKRWPQMGVLIFTIFATDMYIHRMILNGANGFLIKSAPPLEIKNALLSIYNKGTYFSEVVTRNYFRAIQEKKIKAIEFTDKELQVLKLSCSDLNYEEIAQKMNTTKRSVEGYRDSLFKKLNVNSRVSLVIFAIQYGIFPIDCNQFYS